MLTRAVACALVLAAAGCGGGDDPPAARATVTPASTPAANGQAPQVPVDALLGIVTAWNGSGTIVAPVERRSLRLRTPWGELGEYHDAWSLSPDRRMAAFGISAPGEDAGIGVRVLDLATLRPVREIDTGIAAEAVAWLTADRLVAFLQSGDVVVVNPLTGEELSREQLGALSCPFAPPHAVTPLGLVMLIAVGGDARVVRIDHESRLQILRLPDVGIGFAFELCEMAGLAVDPTRLTAYVVAAGSPVAEIDLRTMTARRHRLADPPALFGSPRCRRCVAEREVAWLGGGRLAVTGFNSTVRRATPVGVALLDTRRWTARRLARDAGAVRVAGERLLVYDGRFPAQRPRTGAGLRVYDRDSGALRRTLFAGERIGDVQVAGARVYARAWPGRILVADLRTGRRLGDFPGRRREIELMVPR